MSTKSVMKLVKTYLQNHASFDDHGASVAAGYSMATHLYHRFQEVKYLRISAASGTGNTIALHAVGCICFNPIFMYGMSSQESMLYALDGANKLNGATMCLDDVAFKMVDKDGSPTTFANILSTGAIKGNRIVKANAVNYVSLDAFGPKVLARSASFNNPAIDSKFITVSLVQRDYLYAHDLLSVVIKEKDAVVGAISEWAESLKSKKQTQFSFVGLIEDLSAIQLRRGEGVAR